MTAGEARALRMAGQGLSEKLGDPMEALRRCVVIQTQYATSLPVALAARGPAVTPDWCQTQLEVDGPLRKLWTVRFTLHTAHEEDSEMLVRSFGEYAALRFERFMQRRRGLSAEVVRDRDERIWAELKKGPMDRKALHDCIPELRDMPGTGWGLDAMNLAYGGKLYVKSHLGATTFVACEPPASSCSIQATTDLLRRYLTAYAPATKPDFAHWSGLPMSRINPAFDRLEPELEWVDIDGFEKPYALLAGSKSASSESIRLLAKFDPYVMAHKEKGLYLDPRLYKQIYRPAAQVEATVLIDGRLAGTWRAERKGRRLTVRVESFARLPKRVWKALEREAQSVAQGLGHAEAEVAPVEPG